jgi:hypothetical protein
MFDQTFGRTLKAQQFIWSFQSYMALGRPSAATAIAEEMGKFARDFIVSQNFGTEEQQKAALVPLTTQVLGATLDTIDNAHVAADAACIVFAHSLIDGAVLDYCRVSAMLNVDDWASEVLTEKITLQQAVLLISTYCCAKRSTHTCRGLLIKACSRRSRLSRQSASPGARRFAKAIGSIGPGSGPSTICGSRLFTRMHSGNEFPRPATILPIFGKLACTYRN